MCMYVLNNEIFWFSFIIKVNWDNEIIEQAYREQRNMAANSAEIDYMYNKHNTVDSLLSKRINIRIKSREATLADFKIMLLFFRQCWINIWNCNKKLVLKIIYSRSLIQNSRNTELGTCVKNKEFTVLLMKNI